MKSRSYFVITIPKEYEERMEKGECPVCGLHKDKWNRRTDWNCCSKDCTEKYWTKYYSNHWQNIRWDALKRDKFICVKCGYKGKDDGSDLIGDHIIPIALGGEEFELENVQTLCIICDKIKTKEDQKNISKKRKIEKVQSINKQLNTQK